MGCVNLRCAWSLGYVAVMVPPARWVVSVPLPTKPKAFGRSCSRTAGRGHAKTEGAAAAVARSGASFGIEPSR